MLVVLTTDAVADAAALDTALRRAAALTFDRLDVDGSCSTNDTVLLLSSGASEVTPSQDDLDAAVLAVCEDLCAQLQADAEGATAPETLRQTDREGTRTLESRRMARRRSKAAPFRARSESLRLRRQRGRNDGEAIAATCDPEATP